MKISLLESQKFDWFFLLSLAALSFIGFSTLQSATLAGGGNELLIKLQALAFFVGFILFVLIYYLDYRYLQFLAIPAYFTSLILLGLLFVFGSHIRGSVRWFDLGYFQLQPAELVKPLLVVAFCGFLSFFKERVNHFLILIGLVILAFIPIFLVYKQPDLGTVVVLLAGLICSFFFSRISWKRILIFFLILLIFLPILFFKMAPYQKQRVLTFLDPVSDPLGSGYNVIQSTIAVGSGNLFGRGWGRGTQSHLRFLPEEHTDFVFATFAEENGFLGSMVLIFLYLLLFVSSLKVLLKAKKLFGRLLVAGSMAIIFTQAAINIGMNIGVLPVTGIPLPLVSYGGSNVVTSLVLLGFIASVAKDEKV